MLSGGYTMTSVPGGNQTELTDLMSDANGKVTSFKIGNSVYRWDSHLKGYRAEFWPSGGTDLIQFWKVSEGLYTYEWTIHSGGGTESGTAAAN
jgi:hypothetical protein